MAEKLHAVLDQGAQHCVKRFACFFEIKLQKSKLEEQNVVEIRQIHTYQGLQANAAIINQVIEM